MTNKLFLTRCKSYKTGAKYPAIIAVADDDQDKVTYVTIELRVIMRLLNLDEDFLDNIPLNARIPVGVVGDEDLFPGECG